MITVDRSIPDFEPFSDLLGYSPENSLFFDIETTGFSADTSMVYLIGMIFRDGEGWRLTQLLAEAPADEKELLETFFAVSAKYTALIHFNGNAFDLPFVKRRAEMLQLSHNLNSMQSLDLYRRYRPLKDLLGLQRMNQSSLEVFLGWQRRDRLSGKQMADLFPKYAASAERSLRELLLLHNHDDMLGMIQLLRAAAYLPLYERHPESILSVRESGENVYDCVRLIFTLAHPVPAELSLRRSCTLLLSENRGLLTIPLRSGTFYHFFPDYRNYYYLPLEDQAIHKSVAAYVDSAYREPARASNCYIKKSGQFLPQPEKLFTPAFKEAPDSPDLYFLYTRGCLSDDQMLRRYLQDMLLSL